MAFFKFRSRGQKGDEASAGPTESIEGMRRRAKHRLIGAAILVLLGVIGFPILFDSQPRPIPVDIAIDIPDKGKAKPIGIGAGGPAIKLEKPAETTDPAPTSTAPAHVPAAASLDPKEEVVTAKSEPQASVPRPEKPAPVKPEPHPEPKQPEPKPVAKAETKPDDSGARAKALLEGKDVAAATASGESRFIVQVGAFADAAKAREARQKLERAGLKTYAQVVDTKDGQRTRVRVGPFSNKAEADKAASKIKGLELSASILTL